MTSTTPTTFNAVDYLLHRHVRDGHGDRSAVVCADVSLTYQELSDETRRVAAGLRSFSDG
jgi:acyl-coenzyme A synthetase/AMP-(fatty) acid ligase